MGEKEGRRQRRLPMIAGRRGARDDKRRFRQQRMIKTWTFQQRRTTLYLRIISNRI